MSRLVSWGIQKLRMQNLVRQIHNRHFQRLIRAAIHPTFSMTLRVPKARYRPFQMASGMTFSSELL